LRFTDSRVGIQCVELPAILDWAQSAELTSAPNPSYSVAEIKVSAQAARVLLRRLKVEEEDARHWGMLLKHEVDSAAQTSRLAAG